MALKLDERYPGRADPASVDYPQGSFKNRTSPTAKDGTYLEKDWANDQQGFFQSLLKSVGVTANGLVDKVGASQYFDALISNIRGSKATESEYGSTRKATQSEVNAGTSDDCSVTPKKLRAGFSMNLSLNGYLSLPTWMGGLIFQWGTATTTAGGIATLVLPTVFPTAGLGRVGSYTAAGMPGNTTLAIGALSTSSVIAYVSNTSGTALSGAIVSFFVWGH